MRGPGKKIGIVNYKAEEKWRCATCKMANDNSLESCARCKDPRKALNDKMPAANKRATSEGVKHPPMRFTMCKKEPKNK